MTTSTPEKADGLQALENAIEKVRETITKLGGVFTVKMAVNIQLRKIVLLSLPHDIGELNGIPFINDVAEGGDGNR